MHRFTGVSYINVTSEYVDENSMGQDELKEIPLGTYDFHEILLEKAQKELELNPELWKKKYDFPRTFLMP